MYADIKTMEWVFDADVTAHAKLVLFALIYHTNKEKGLAFPSQETIGAEVSLSREAVGKILKALTARGLIERVKWSGRSVHYRLTYRPDTSPPKSQIADTGDGKAQEMRTRNTSDVKGVHSRCEGSSQQMRRKFTADEKEVHTNKRIKQKQLTKAPTKEENRPPAIQPTVFKQGDAGAREDNVVDEERERMFEEFWAAYPDRCPRKVDRAKCLQKYAEILAASADPIKLHERMLNALTAWDESEMWNKEGGKYIRAPYTWLDKRSWEDAPAPDKAIAAKKAAAKAEANRTYDWSLCAERCANCGGNRCRAGIKVPPNYGEWASPPETCAYFRSAS